MQSVLYDFGLPLELCDMVKSYAYHSDEQKEKWARNNFKEVMRELCQVSDLRYDFFIADNEPSGNQYSHYRQMAFRLTHQHRIKKQNIRPGDVKTITMRAIMKGWSLYGMRRNHELMIDIDNYVYENLYDDEESDDSEDSEDETDDDTIESHQFRRYNPRSKYCIIYDIQ
jgi:hypothetical protein